MALNYSHRSVFPAHLPDDNLVSPIRIGNGFHVDGFSEKMPWHFERDFGDTFDYGRDRPGNVQESSNDILDVLPSDPFGMDVSSTSFGMDISSSSFGMDISSSSFGMDISSSSFGMDISSTSFGMDISSTSFGMDISTTFTALTGWLEDLEVDYGGNSRRVETRSSSGDYELFAGLNLIWNKTMWFQSLPSGDVGFDGITDGPSGVSDTCFEEASGDIFGHDSFSMDSPMEDMFESSMEGRLDHDLEFENSQMGLESCSGRDAESPHSALHFALAYLGVQDLLAVERVCKSLRATVKSDPLLWMSIHIDQQPLNDKLTDEKLLLLTSRAQGNLQCLSLVECPRITDEGLKTVLQANPKLAKLCVPACTRLSIEGVINSLKAFSSSGSQMIKRLRVGGLYGLTQKHFEELSLLLGSSMHLHSNGQKPHFYCRGNEYISCKDDRAIDIEECPKCQNSRLVYDCPAEGCQGREHGDEVCRACTLCIPRCGQCGSCLNDNEYEETFSLDLRCSKCLKADMVDTSRDQVWLSAL